MNKIKYRPYKSVSSEKDKRWSSSFQKTGEFRRKFKGIPFDFPIKKIHFFINSIIRCKINLLNNQIVTIKWKL